MKLRLILMRHGEATNSAPSDRERPLTQGGLRRVGEVGTQLVDSGFVPNHILSSDARRAAETTNAVVESLKKSKNFNVLPQYFSEFYTQDYPVISKSIKKISTTPECQCILAIGHNPVWSAAVCHYSDQAVGLSPGNAAILEVNADSWAEALELAPSWELVEVI